MDTSAFDRRVDSPIYRAIVEDGRPPTAPELAGALGAPASDVEAAYRRLADGHAIVLAPGTCDVWMANPFSAIPTPFEATVGDRRYFGNCIWDALRHPGLPARRRADRHVLSRLLRAADGRGAATSSTGRRQLRSTSPSPRRGGGHRRHLIDDALPVGRARGTVDRGARDRDRLPPQQGRRLARLVPRPAVTGLATPDARGGAADLRRHRPHRPLLGARDVPAAAPTQIVPN